MKLTVLLSGSGTNFQAILDAIDHQQLNNVEIIKVVADRECQGINRAIDHQIPYEIISRKSEHFGTALQQAIPDDSDFIICAGFLSILPTELVKQFPKKIINIHPSLLPKFGGKGMYGIYVHRAVIANGEIESGCTVHYVDAGIDTGETILQIKVPVLPNDTPESLQKRVLIQEHIALPEAIKMLS